MLQVLHVRVHVFGCDGVHVLQVWWQVVQAGMCAVHRTD
jgi:hypothetical protein